MKKLLLLLLLMTGLASFTPNNTEQLYSTTQTENVECKYSQCQATAKSTGKQCKHCVSNDGDAYCYQHKP